MCIEKVIFASLDENFRILELVENKIFGFFYLVKIKYESKNFGIIYVLKPC